MYYTSNEDLFEECDQEENLTLTGAATASCLNFKIVKYFAQCHVFAQSPPDRRPNDKYPVNTLHSYRFV
jgi:hypothetical protein